MRNDQVAKPLNAAEFLNLPTPTLDDAARKLYGTLPYHFAVYYQSGFGKTIEKARLEKAKFIAENGIPWPHVEYVANDMLQRGKFTRAEIDAEKLAEELTKIRTLARRLNTNYDTEA